MRDIPFALWLQDAHIHPVPIVRWLSSLYGLRRGSETLVVHAPWGRPGVLNEEVSA